MERLAYLVIGASLAVVVMTYWPGRQIDMSSRTVEMEMTETSAKMLAMHDPGAMHQHPPREVSPDLPLPGVTHLMFPDAVDGYNVQILTRNFTFTPAAINRAPEDNEGHAHIYVNGVKIARVYSTWYHLSGALLRPGDNDVSVTLNANDHSEWAVDGKPISSVVRVRLPIDGP